MLGGASEGNAHFGDFHVQVYAENENSKLRSLAIGINRGSTLAREHAASGDPFDAIVVYDPLKSGLTGWWASRRHGIPLIVEVNGDYTARVNYITPRGRLAGSIKRWLFMTIERFTLRRASGIKILYPAQIRAFTSSLRSPVIRAFPEFVDTARFADRGEQPEILFVGFPFYLKGVDLLIDAFKSLSRDFPEWRLKLLGWFENIDEVVAYVGNHERIVIHPPVPFHEVPEHVGRCGILVLPSRSEAMGRVLVEAMSCGKPCIGSDVGGIPTVIRDGENGLLFRSGDSADLARALRQLMGSETLRREMGAHGVISARVTFSPETYFAHAAEFYNAVLAARGAP